MWDKTVKKVAYFFLGSFENEGILNAGGASVSSASNQEIKAYCQFEDLPLKSEPSLPMWNVPTDPTILEIEF